MINQQDIANLQSDIQSRIGQKIIVKGSYGRSKLYEKTATIEGVYPSYFRIKFDGETNSTAHQYQSVLRGEIKVDVQNGDEYTPLVEPIVRLTRKEKALAKLKSAMEEMQQQNNEGNVVNV